MKSNCTTNKGAIATNACRGGFRHSVNGKTVNSSAKPAPTPLRSL
ncbi:MAG TPA: hypothetical protein V6C78_15130 [Crinalium sp.]